jgi:hypothetical protein
MDLLPFSRKDIDLLDQKIIAGAVSRLSQKKKNEQAVVAAALLVKNDEMIMEIEEARKERGYIPLADDPAFKEAKEKMTAADLNHSYLVVFRLACQENIKLLHEVNVHRKHFGKELMPVFKS